VPTRGAVGRGAGSSRGSAGRGATGAGRGAGGRASGRGSADSGPPLNEPPFDPDYDPPPSGGYADYGFDPGDEPLDDETEAAALGSSEEQALRLLAEQLGAEKIGETPTR
jgi:DNA polymerase-3 subunit gamma/tau